MAAVELSNESNAVGSGLTGGLVSKVTPFIKKVCFCEESADI